MDLRTFAAVLSESTSSTSLVTMTVFSADLTVFRTSTTSEEAFVTSSAVACVSITASSSVTASSTSASEQLDFATELLVDD